MESFVPNLLDGGNDETSSTDSDSDDQARSMLSTDDPSIQRIVARNMPMHQSRGAFNIGRIGVHRGLLLRSRFFLMLSLPTGVLLLCCFTVYLIAWLLFAVWWYNLANKCETGLSSFVAALYLSIETMMTIGYGVPDPYFNDCLEVLPLLICQSWTSLLIDLVIIGILFQRISRAHKRASTIIFSDKLLLRIRGGSVELAFRIAEMQDGLLMQVVLQAYVLLHRVDLFSALDLDEASSAEGEVGDCEEVVLKAVRLQGLDDNNNALLCGVPMTVTHTIDRDSPLAPCNRWSRACSHESDLKDVIEHLKELPYLEILVILSGIEKNTGASVEGRQSYTLNEIVAGHEFGRCVSLDANGRHCIDFVHFNQTFAVQRFKNFSGGEQD